MSNFKFKFSFRFSVSFFSLFITSPDCYSSGFSLRRITFVTFDSFPARFHFLRRQKIIPNNSVHVIRRREFRSLGRRGAKKYSRRLFCFSNEKVPVDDLFVFDRMPAGQRRETVQDFLNRKSLSSSWRNSQHAISPRMQQKDERIEIKSHHCCVRRLPSLIHFQLTGCGLSISFL